ncbi:MAG: hypothetical protein FWB83_07660 [Treponema sp.]|nr:hypothetical protein [Treponema sp.]
MKDKKRILGIIAIAAMIGFAFVSCDEGGSDSGGSNNGGNGNGGGSVSGMETLNLSGQVYLEDFDGVINTYTSYTGSDLEIDDSLYAGGSGSIINGNLNYSVEVPRNLKAMGQEFFETLFNGYTIAVSRQDVEGYIILHLFAGNGVWLQKIYRTGYISGNSFDSSYERVDYIYVDKDVTITGTGGTVNKSETENEVVYNETYISNSFSIMLKTGWNAVYEKSIQTGTFEGSIENLTSVTAVETTTISLGNPSLRWVLR